jgi:hypothetical protein
MPGKIFINYRRGDDPGNTGRLFDRLERTFSAERLFMDVDSIKPGIDFVRVLEEQVGQSDVMLTVIGEDWINARDTADIRRLDNHSDYVRAEIRLALNQGKRVIPVLIGNARFPRPDELPEDIRGLSTRNAVRLTHERFRSEVQSLINVIQEALVEAEKIRRSELEKQRRDRKIEARRRAEEAKASLSKSPMRTSLNRARYGVLVMLAMNFLLYSLAVGVHDIMSLLVTAERNLSFLSSHVAGSTRADSEHPDRVCRSC